MPRKSKEKVFVGMSGGVDSSVSAALLQKEGYEVVGVFMKVWQPDFLPCTWQEERLDAIRVAAHLGIPLLTWDLEKEYKEGVFDYMIREYKAGRTPNPDVMCNKEVKFGAFFRRAMAEGADFVATGHYAQSIFNKKTNLYELREGVDSAKDQSYFLWTLGQEHLSKTLFPVGSFPKAHTRALAKKFKLPVAEKKDSQGLCFVGKLDMKEFLAHFLETKEGNVLDSSGAIVGTHRGAVFYTLGERHGFTITKKTTSDERYFVVAKDLISNTITVAHNPADALPERSGGLIELSVTNLPEAVASGFACDARIRYHGERLKCSLESRSESSVTLRFEVPVMVALGQSVVLYVGTTCLGGGIVENVQ